VSKKEDTINMGRLHTIKAEKSLTISNIKIIKGETKMRIMIFQKELLNNPNHMFKMIKYFGSPRIHKKE
jgi:hypothetical protein